MTHTSPTPPGFTLTELVITLAVIGVLIWIGAAALRTDELAETREAAVEVTDMFRRARYLASRLNNAVVLVVRPYSAQLPGGGGITRGRIEAYIQAGSTCPSGDWNPTDLGLTPDLTPVDFGTFAGADLSSAPGIARIEPTDLATDHFCVRPNGRILNRFDNAPIRPTGTASTDLAGKATIWVQYSPIRVDPSQNLVVPYMAIEIPYNGLVRIAQ
ncbi:MAG: prepilin-type N-terminal cleavage/methylation domain-containing protein [Bradymonadales bacterium]|nr:prepilin-type N-terminal cleavage/methylation domain-containing protein [Bradymonadales bacterium]